MNNSCGRPTPRSAKRPTEANAALLVGAGFRERRRKEDRLVHRPAHGGDPAHFVDRGPDDSEIEPLLAAYIAVEHLAEMEPEIHVGRRQALLEPARVQGGHRLLRRPRRVERGGAGAVSLLRRENGEHAVADQLEHVAGVLVDRRHDRLGVVIEQRNDLLRGRGVGDARIIAQIAEPQHRLDPVRHPAFDPAPQHPPSGVPTEIGLDQGLGDAGERGGFDCEPKERREALQRPDVLIGKTFGPIRRPIGIDAIHFADRAVLGEAVDDCDIVGELRFAKLHEGRKLSLGLRGHAEAQQQFAADPEPVKRARPPAFRRLAFAGSAVFGQRRFRLFLFPPERPPLVNGVERVDEHEGARERQSAGDGPVAKALDQSGFRPPFEPRLREPGRKLGDFGFGHGAIIKRPERKANAPAPACA